MGRFIRWIKNCDAHQRMLVAGAAALVMLLVTLGRWRLPVQIVAAWNVFGGWLLLLSWIQILADEPARFLSTAKLRDFSRTTIFFAVLAASCMSLFAVAYLIGTAKGLNKASLSGHVMLAAATVVCSWCLIHTLFALRYAHIFHGDIDDGAEGRAGGVDFPQEPNPDYLDFAYFSFVIGMTC